MPTEINANYETFGSERIQNPVPEFQAGKENHVNISNPIVLKTQELAVKLVGTHAMSNVHVEQLDSRSIGPIMGELNGVQGDAPKSIAGLSNYFKTAAIFNEKEALFRSLTAGVMWANNCLGLRVIFDGVRKEFSLGEYPHLYRSLDRMQQKQTRVPYEMNNATVIHDWNRFFTSSIDAYLSAGKGKADLNEADNRLVALAVLLQRPIVLVDAQESTDGSIVAYSFSASGKERHEISAGTDMKLLFHDRTLFSLATGNSYAPLLSGEDPTTH
jgi:hypothetical protein